MKFLLLTISIFLYINTKFISAISSNLKQLPNSGPKVTFLVNKNQDSYLSVPGNTTFSVSIEGNPSTGYVTYIKNYENITKANNLKIYNLAFDNTTKLYTSKIFEKKNNTSDADATPGFYKFEMRAIKPFKDLKIEFITVRPWEIQKPNKVEFKNTIKMSTTNTLEFSYKV